MPRLFCYAAPIEGDAIAGRLGLALRLGVGKTAAAATLAAHLASGPRPESIVLFGVAGAYPPRHGGTLAVGDLCLVGRDALADDGVERDGRWQSLDALRLGECGPFAMDEALTARAAAALGVPIVAANTVSACSASDAASARLAARHGAAVESMEGAAVAFVCRRFDVPLIQLRAVSNATGDAERAGWDLRRAVDGVQRAVLDV